MSLLKNQYKLIQESRRILVEFFKDISDEDFTKTIKDFDRGSIRDTLVHIANVYEYWIGHFSMKLSIPITEKSEITKFAWMKVLYSDVDLLMDSFIEKYKKNMEFLINGEVRWS